MARDTSNEVGVYAHGKANHVDGFLYVGLPVAALFGVVNLVDNDVVLFLAVGRDVEGGEPGFAAVLRACEEVENLLFLGDDTRLLLAAVGYALGTEYRLPVFRTDLYVVFYWR